MSSSRHIPWPSIENLGVSYANAVKGRYNAVTLAVLMLQRWWRWVRRVRSGELDPRKCCCNFHLSDRGRPLTPLALYHRLSGSIELYDATPCFVAEKYDGTNVGKASDGSGTLYGRRSMIDSSVMSFQKASLSTVRSIDTVPLKDAILSELGESQRALIRDIVFYGELMLGHDKFNYRPRGINSGDWICFGAKIVLDDTACCSSSSADNDDNNDNQAEGEEDTNSSSKQVIDDICSQLRQAGFAITSGLTMFMSPKLREIIGDRFPTVRSVIVADSITSLVLDSPDIVTSLLASTCEGVVVTGLGGKFSLKWKSSKEEESQAAALLQQALDLTEQREFRASIAVSDRMINAMQILRSIAAQLSSAPSNSSQKDAKTRVVKPDPIAQLQPELQQAYASALTKFDSLEVYFAQGDKQLNEFTAMVAREVASDLETNARNRSSNPETPLEVAEKQRLEQVATLYVRRTIGKAYGAFKKGANTK